MIGLMIKRHRQIAKQEEKQIPSDDDGRTHCFDDSNSSMSNEIE